MRRSKRNPNSVARRAASIAFMKIVLTEFYTPTQVAEVSFDTRVDLGMDNEVLEFYKKIVRKYGKVKREIYPFEIFKLITLYCNIADVRGIVGRLQMPEPEIAERTAHTKLEKIRMEIVEYQTRERPPSEPHVVKLLDYVLEMVTKKFKYVEMVDYEKVTCKLESVIDKLCDAAPRKEVNTGHPGIQTHTVFCKALSAPDRRYVISEDIYEMFPQLKEFFESKHGVAFYKCYMQYIAKQFPKMQSKILDHVNAFANRYFRWMVEMLSFPENVPEMVRWKYTPMAMPPTESRTLLRYYVFKENGRVRANFIFLDEVRVILEKLAILKFPFVGNAPTLLSASKTAPPAVHQIAEFNSANCVMMMLRRMTPEAEKYIEIIESEMHALGVVDRKCLPIISPHNTHCIPSAQGFKRIVEILVDEVKIGERMPLNFRCLQALIQKMENLFAGSQLFKTMVDRDKVFEMMNEATELKGKFNGKLTTPSGRFGEIRRNVVENKEATTEVEKLEIFLDSFNQFAPLVTRHAKLPIPIPAPIVASEDLEKTMTPEGEPEMEVVYSHIIG